MKKNQTENIFSIKILLIFLLVLSLFSGCQNSGKRYQPHKDTTIQETIVEIPPDTETVLNIDSNSEDISNDYPMLFIENSGALWQQSCISSTYQADTMLVKQAYDFLGTTNIISIGKKGIQSQNIIEPYCMSGECGESQVAFKFSNNEYLGIIVSKDFIKDIDTVNLFEKFTMSIEFYQKLKINEDFDSSFANTYYQDTTHKVIVQITAHETIQENDWPYYENITWRLIKLTSTGWKYYNRVYIKLNSTNLPFPLAITYHNNEMKIIWCQEEGICCPSYSFTWICYINKDSSGQLKFKDSKPFPGGFGQPCD